MRAVVYSRVSSAEQRERHTIASQLRTLPDFVARQGWTLVRPPETYVDDGRSASAGKLDKREAFTKLLADARAGHFDVVAVVAVDRLTRSDDIAERGAIIGAFQVAGVRLAIASSGQVWDLRSADGDLLALLGAFFAADENRKRRDRFARGRIETARRNRKTGGLTLYGLRYEVQTGAWSLDESRAPIVREVFERVARGESLYAIAKELGARGLERPRGGAWSRGRLVQMIRNPGYRGAPILTQGISGRCPAIVDETTWYTAQDALGARARATPQKRQTPALLEDLARCGVCGSKIYLTSSGVRRRYVCGSKRQEGRHADRCPCPTRQVHKVDALVWGLVQAFVEDPEVLSSALELRRAATSAESSADELAQLERKLERNGRLERGHLERARRGVLSEVALDHELQVLARERDLLARTLDMTRRAAAAAARSSEELQEIETTVAALRERVASTDPLARREILRTLVPGRDGLHVMLHPDRIVLLAAVEERPIVLSAPYDSRRRAG